MDISRVNLIYFSPTGGTKKVGEYIAQKIAGGKDFNASDITVSDAEISGKKYTCDELGRCFCFPVYGGRVPFPLVERLKSISSDGTPAVIIAVYGNRAYDDALLEMESIINKLGFKTVAAGAFIAEHSVIRSFGKGRPDAADIKAEKDFAEAVVEMICKATSTADLSAIKFQDKPKYKKYNGIPLKPHAGSKCVRCRLCALNCPMGAISVSDPSQTDTSKCISCMRCIEICPKSARKLNPALMAIAKVLMKKYCSVRKKPEMFI